MDLIQFEIANNGKGRFFIQENNTVLGQLLFRQEEDTLIAYSTEVTPVHRKKGSGSALFEAMVDYARDHKLRIIASCSFIRDKFKAAAGKYSDIWKED